MDERALAERLIAADTSTLDGLRGAAGFVKGWLEARDVDVVEHDYEGLPILMAEVGAKAEGAPTVILHGHLDVVPAHADQFTPRVEGDRLIGRGAYDMKGGLAAMMCALQDAAAQDASACASCACPTRSPRTSRRTRSTASSATARSPATSRSPASRPTCTSASRPRACSRCASSSAGPPPTARRPWLGDNAILKAHDTFRRIETLPFSRESSDLFDRPSINLARINGGDAFNKVPDRCEMEVDIRFLPGQDAGAILAQIRALPDTEIVRCATWPPAVVPRTNPFVVALREASAGSPAARP
jgi:succinyl-diaminopimelate desuccinylase